MTANGKTLGTYTGIIATGLFTLVVRTTLRVPRRLLYLEPHGVYTGYVQHW